MMFAPLLLPEVQKRLALAISAELPEDVPCALGYPPRGLQIEHVWISGDFTSEITRETSGYTARDESGTVNVRILMRWPADEYETPAGRAFELEECIERAVARDRTLDGLIYDLDVVRVDGQEAIPDETTREVGLTVAVRYRGTSPAET